MKLGICKFIASALFATATLVMPAQAAVVIAGTRVVFPGQEREVTIKLSNEGAQPVLVQAWLDEGDANASPELIDVPFVLTPAMFRLDPSNGQTLRLIHSGKPMAQDKETLYWLNVLEVPPKNTEGGNRLQLALRTRIKVMYRPAGLAGKAADAPASVQWELARNEAGTGYALKGSNPTPYFVNLGSVEVRNAAKVFDAGAGYIAPGGSALFPVSGLADGGSAEVVYSAINDWGSSLEGVQALARPADR